MDTLDLHVRYRLHEYKELVIEFRPRSAGNGGGNRPLSASSVLEHPLITRLAVALIAPPVFLYKSWRVGKCRFVVSSIGVTRSGAGHEATYRWEEVMHLHRLSSAYMIELEEGALPLPYRVFAADQRQAFESLLPARLRALSESRPRTE
jgi:hypothetical protein